MEQANDANDMKDTTGMNSDKDSAMVAPAINDDVADFAVKAANGGMMEVDMGKIAEQKAKSKAVKDFAAMMVKDHSKANEELTNTCSRKEYYFTGNSWK